jgi:GWxTD domain-containing protein
MGGVTRADSLFRRTIPRLARLAREKFDDIAPVASAQDTATSPSSLGQDQVTFIQRFWREHDPDLVSPENEAQLEYWSRVTQAYFLFFDTRRKEWDMRGEVYVRYGPPEQAAYNPMTSALVHLYSTGPAYPMNLLVWNYPSLGMQVQLEDRLLSEYYLLPRSMVYDMDPQPAPGAWTCGMTFSAPAVGAACSPCCRRVPSRDR